MNKLLNHIESEPLSGRDILEAVDDKTKVILYSAIHQYRNIEQLLEPHDSCVILYETRPRFGHWVCVFLNRDTGVLEFFDPYGKQIDSQLNHIPKKFRDMTYQNSPYLSRLMLNSPYRLTYNDKPLQKIKNGTNSCGRHVALRLVMRNLSIREYQKFLTSKLSGPMTPDKMVSMLTAFV